MIIYTYRTPKLFFLHLLLALAEAFEGMVALMTLGCVRFSISYIVFPKIAIAELMLRKTLPNTPEFDNDPWPRWQIWPRRKK